MQYQGKVAQEAVLEKHQAMGEGKCSGRQIVAEHYETGPGSHECCYQSQDRGWSPPSARRQLPLQAGDGSALQFARERRQYCHLQPKGG
jgi:hypothetical protein